ncbi:hypothetical protein [Streptomyces lonarensis]|uniref:Antimicrobial peptide, SdpC family n=1 Tax=Streptomyces lonarensis TaxID=700599 RepID=A0A7X6I141_9ACTN|nr:hypothetical protein [Streptomyces lonarensis]NJQ08428.1 hypothetical protein [Streptomyces lonarensis]
MKFSPKTIATAAAVALIAGAGVVGTAQASTAAAPASHEHLIEQHAATATEDGRDLLRGLVFTQGPVADGLIKAGFYNDTPEVLEHNRSADAVAAADALLDTIERNEPTFFADFSADLRSGDPRRVQSGLETATKVLAAHQTAIDEAVEPYGQGACVMAIVAVNVLAIGNAVAVFNAQYAWDIQHFYSQVIRGELGAEESIAQLATVLRTA